MKLIKSKYDFFSVMNIQKLHRAGVLGPDSEGLNIEQTNLRGALPFSSSTQQLTHMPVSIQEMTF